MFTALNFAQNQNLNELNHGLIVMLLELIQSTCNPCHNFTGFNGQETFNSSI